KQFLKLKEKMEGLIDSGEDSVRYYRLCGQCLPQCELSGFGERPQKRNYKVL
ncbi:MAG: CRISPR-associated endonuclease Cas2, partial [Deltaproteobacteria bacterium CG23_combo_of_CG06-09_8_20_14_all_51_20]